MQAAVAWLTECEKLSGDPAKIHIGSPAGGHLVAMLLATDWPAHASDLPADLVKSVTAISGLRSRPIPTYRPTRISASMPIWPVG